MGTIYSLTCKNKMCRYHVELREGVGIINSYYIKKLEARIRMGNETKYDEIRKLLNMGFNLECSGTYMCPSCMNYQMNDAVFIFEATHVSPYGTIRNYKIHYVEAKPECKECGMKLEYVYNPRSSISKCPKCKLGEMKYNFTGYFD